MAEKKDKKQTTAKKVTKKQTKKDTNFDLETLKETVEKFEEAVPIKDLGVQKSEESEIKVNPIHSPSEEDIKVYTDQPTLNEDLSIESEKSIEIPEENQGGSNKIIKKVSQYFGYLWNGQAIDY